VNGRLVLGLALGALACGCGAAPAGSPAPVSFSGPPFETVASASGALRIGVRWSPPSPVKGDDAVELTFVDVAGNLVDGLTTEVVPWMPAHGHGTSVEPVATSTTPGVIVASPVYLFMSGEWQLRLTLTGAAHDSAVVTAQIP
jgi:hypothetical protein